MSARKISLTLHLWVGLFAAIFLFIEGVTGGILAWGPQIYQAFNPPGPRVNGPVYHVPPGGADLSLTELAFDLEKSHPGFRLRLMQFPAPADRAWVAGLQSPALASLTVWFDPHTGETLGERAQSSRFDWMVRVVQVAGKFHGNIVGGVALLLLALSGLILWWPRKIFGLGLQASAARTNFNLHNAIGFYSSLFLLVFSGTAVVMSSPGMAIRVIGRLTHTSPPAPPPRPAKPAGPKAVSSDSNRRARSTIRLDFDQLLKAAAAGRPGVRFTDMRVSNDGNGVVIFSYQAPGTPKPQTNIVVVDPFTGRLRDIPNPNDFTLPEKIVRIWVRQIHTGEIIGRPSRWIAGFFSFMLAILAATGPAIWWNRRRENRARLQAS